MQAPPHYQRLRRRLEELPAPLVQIWGWPGTGKRAFLARLAAAEPTTVRVLDESTVGREERLDEAMLAARQDGVRWLLYEGAATAKLDGIVQRLHPDQSLLITTSVFGLRPRGANSWKKPVMPPAKSAGSGAGPARRESRRRSSTCSLPRNSPANTTAGEWAEKTFACTACPGWKCASGSRRGAPRAS